MVVEALRSEHLCQVALVSRGLLQLSPLILEPDLDLRLVQSQLIGQVAPPVLGEVAVVVKLLPQPSQLLGAEGGAGALLLRLAAGDGSLLLLYLPRPRTCNEEKEGNKSASRKIGSSLATSPPIGLSLVN